MRTRKTPNTETYSVVSFLTYLLCFLIFQFIKIMKNVYHAYHTYFFSQNRIFKFSETWHNEKKLWDICVGYCGDFKQLIVGCVTFKFYARYQIFCQAIFYKLKSHFVSHNYGFITFSKLRLLITRYIQYRSNEILSPKYLNKNPITAAAINVQLNKH